MNKELTTKLNIPKDFTIVSALVGFKSSIIN
jgi:hypothetical protein